MRRLLTAAATLALLISAFGPIQQARAAPPANDNFADALAIAALPFSSGDVDISEATTEPGEPMPCNYSPGTVWFSFTPTTSGRLTADMAGSDFSDTNLAVYLATDPGIGGLSLLYCVSYGGPIGFMVQAGSTYYLQAGAIYSYSGNLRLDVDVVPAPANDNFADAALITSLAFFDSVDLATATVEAGEPVPSSGGCYLATNLGATAWYRFTPAATGSYTVAVPSAGSYPSVAAVYTGTALDALTEIACAPAWASQTFRATAGTTYSIQVGGVDPGLVAVSLDVAPAPVAAFWYVPVDPSAFDAVQFVDSSYDPASLGFASWAWDFGDGATSNEPNPTHHYAKDGDYTVKLSVTTYDGRTGSVSQVVLVRTHDVAITKLTVPTAASAGQTRPISVGISDLRYPERVQVQVFKSTASGFDLVGTLTQTVPVRMANRTTPFSFNYTFTKADAALGKVTFRAEATIVDARDALPADNIAIALPTKVSR